MIRRRGSLLTFWRLGFAAALCTAAGAGVAAAQTVYVRNAPAGSTVELVLNTATIGSAAADDRGDAALKVPESAGAKPQMDVLLFVEGCEKRTRVLIIERGAPAVPVEPGCIRREIPGLFIVRALSTLVIDTGGAAPTVLLRQRPFVPTDAPRTWRPSPEGLVFFGGGSHTQFSETGAIACGDITECYRDDSGPGYHFGVAYWFLPFLAAEATFVQPAEVSALGAQETHNFSTTLDSDVLTLAGVAGLPAGALRVYGRGGLTYHRATFSTIQTIDDKTITVDGVTRVVPGGTQTLAFRTEGWGWIIGGGLEAWITRQFAIYGDLNWGKLKGTDVKGGEGVMDDTLLLINFGAKIHIGK